MTALQIIAEKEELTYIVKGKKEVITPTAVDRDAKWYRFQIRQQSTQELANVRRKR